MAFFPDLILIQKKDLAQKVGGVASSFRHLEMKGIRTRGLN